jgi:hypothetical protein
MADFSLAIPCALFFFFFFVFRIKLGEREEGMLPKT